MCWGDQNRSHWEVKFEERVEGGEEVRHGVIYKKTTQVEGEVGTKALRQETVGALKDSKRRCSWRRVSRDGGGGEGKE